MRAQNPPGMEGPAEKKRFGPYEIVGRLGFGGMGIVLDARGDDGKPVALKLLRPTGDAHKHKVFAARFHREAKILKKLTHPGVVRLLDSGTIHGIFFLAMERIEGKSLGALLKRASMDAETIVALGIKLGETLAHLHEIGVVHRDIKPDNVIIDTSGHPILTDFGLARLSGGTAITRANELVGSLGYIAPEVIEGSAPSPMSDQYALGRLMFNLAVKKPEDSNDGVPLIEALQRSMKVDWTNFPKDGAFLRLAEVISRMVAREPAQRFPDMYSLILELDTLSRTFAEADQGTDKFAALRAKTDAPKPRALTQSAPPESEVRQVSRNWEDDTRWDPDAEKKLLAIAAQFGQPPNAPWLASELSAPAALRENLEWVRPATDRDFVGLSGAIALGQTDVLEEVEDPSGNVGDTIDMMIKLRKRRALPYSVIEAPAADLSDRAARLRKVTQQFWSDKLKVADTNPPEPPAEQPPDVLEHWRHIVDDLGSFTADVKTVKMTPMAIAEAGGEDFRVPPPADRARGAISFMRSVEPELVIEPPVEAELEEDELPAHEASTIPPALAIVFEEPTIPPEYVQSHAASTAARAPSSSSAVPPPSSSSASAAGSRMPSAPTGYRQRRGSSPGAAQRRAPSQRRPKAPPMQAPPIPTPMFPPDIPTEPRQSPSQSQLSASQLMMPPEAASPRSPPQQAQAQSPSRSQPPQLAQTPSRSQPPYVGPSQTPSRSEPPQRAHAPSMSPSRSQPPYAAPSQTPSRSQPPYVAPSQSPSRSQPPYVAPSQSPSRSQPPYVPSRSQPTQPPQSTSRPQFAPTASRSQPPQVIPVPRAPSTSQLQPVPSRSQPPQILSTASVSPSQPLAPSRSQPQHFAQGPQPATSVSTPQLAPSRSQPTQPAPVAPWQTQPTQPPPSRSQPTQPSQPAQSAPQPQFAPPSRSQPTQPAQPASTPPPKPMLPMIEAAIESALEAETFSPLIAYPDTETTAPPSKPLPMAPSVIMAEQQSALAPLSDRPPPASALATPVMMPSLDMPRAPRRTSKLWIAAVLGGVLAAAALAFFLWSKTR